jgi:site-specific recombinase XerD
MGLLTLQNLVDHIGVRGHRWYTRARGIGHGKSQQILAWLNQQSDPAFSKALTRSVMVPAQRYAIEKRQPLSTGLSPGMELVRPPIFGIVPLERLMLPIGLNGLGGVFRSEGPNTLDAHTDMEAVNAWLAHHQERESTARSYRKEAERFVLFCAHVLRKPLSSVTAPDCMQYRAFLMDVPLHWIHPMPVTRTDPMWRPFRGQPSAASQKQAMVILQAMFEALRNANYVRANPFAAVIKGFNLPTSAIDLDRSLSQAEWRFVTEQAQSLTGTAQGRRLCLVLDLLFSTGLRLDELANAERQSMKHVSVDGETEKAWILEVTGKRRKRRVVPISDELALRLEEHARDAAVANMAYGESPALAQPAGPSALPSSTPATPLALPLIYSMNPAVAQWVDVQGVATLNAPISHWSPQGLSASGIYRTLKRFFHRCSQLASEAELDALHLDAASTHWLRHSFGRQAAVSGVPLEVISQAMGHASLTTTSIYLTQERSRMIKELRKIHATAGADSSSVLR